MIPFAKAVKIVMAAGSPVKPACTVSLAQACGRILYRDARIDRDLPPADMSAMDGFACRRSDRDLPLRVVETIPAGVVPTVTIAEGECSRIMTGAPIPKGADMVVMFEDVREKGGMVFVKQKRDNPNIRRCGEDIKKGMVALKQGTEIKPAHVATLASCGLSRVAVFRRVVVGVIATGDELVEPAFKPKAGQIRNSNGPQLMAQIAAAGGEPQYFGIAADNAVSIKKLLKKALKACDVVLLSGGVSAGDFDCVVPVLRHLGVNVKFEKIAIKPGKPTVFGMKGSHAIFGLPGNPVSTFVLFEMLVKPFLLKLMGQRHHPMTVSAPLEKAISRKHADRQEFIPVRFTGRGTVEQVSYHGSAHIHAYTEAEGIISVEAGIERVEAEQAVAVRLIV
ncbi:MAG: molybdopterin molybdotransferase MoeA [Chitinivibrionales bacterium]|nr:molybdopterin molybdotransferase MoeA [Chitinivibrionales bacterium]